MRVAGETWPLPLSARDTVAVDTPARRATASIPGMASSLAGGLHRSCISQKVYRVGHSRFRSRALAKYCCEAPSVMLLNVVGCALASYPSGQRDLTVNQTAEPSGVRIPHLPPA